MTEPRCPWCGAQARFYSGRIRAYECGVYWHDETGQIGDTPAACLTNQLAALAPLVRAVAKYSKARQNRTGGRGVSPAMAVAIHAVDQVFRDLPLEVRKRYADAET